MTVRFITADVFAGLTQMPDESVDCVVTSPPYWGLRDYGVEGQIGLEPTLGEHLEVMLRVFAEVHRVLKPTGTCWVNYGDCYATSPNGRSAADTKAAGNDDRTFRDKPFSTVGPVYKPGYEKTSRVGLSANKGSIAAAHGGRVVAGGYLKPKDLCMVPNRFAIAMQEWGWWVRSEVIWAKPNPMPESIKDRPATSHEKVFLFTKAPRYHYDAEAVRQQAAEASVARWAQDVEGQKGSTRANGGAKTNGTMKAVGGSRRRKQDGTGDSAAGAGGSSARRMVGFNLRWDAKEADGTAPVGRNLRNYEPAPVEVWPIATKPFKEAHFATFPPELAERCIKAGCPSGGHVLDPFGGAGTTGLVADRLARDCTLIEINPQYVALAQKRIAEDQGPLVRAIEQGARQSGLFDSMEAAE